MTTVHRIICPIPFPLKTVNCYYLHDACPTLIDTGLDAAENLRIIQTAVEAAGGTLSGIKRIVLTHAHTDHVGLAGKLARISRAEVFIHGWDAAKIISGDPDKEQAFIQHFRRFLETAGLPGKSLEAILDAFARRIRRLVSPLSNVQVLSGGESLSFDDFSLQVLHTPGHSAGSICLFNAEQGELFSGDTLLEKITPNPVVELMPPRDDGGYRSLSRYTASLDRLAALAVKKVRPGHGSAFGGHCKRVEQIKRHHRLRKQTILQMLRNASGRREGDPGPSLCQLSGKLFPSLKELDMFLGLSEVRAYLDLLEFESSVAVERLRGVNHFKARPA
jgi:glyoxylase-like metal-dependent hydrolase (beta-lactamase superfamily II)